MRLIPLLTALVAFLVLAVPASAHHKPGHQGGPPPGDGRGGNPSSDENGPESGPGNSGAARWCKGHFHDAGRGDPFPFENRGQCVSYFAGGGTVDDADDDTDDNHGDLRIVDVQVYRDGTFRLRGAGAEDRVFVSIGGVSGQVVGFGETDPESDGEWEVLGEWACRDDDARHDARVVVRDSDERARWQATFACQDLDN